MVLRRLKDRLGALNVAVAEVAHQDLWQRAGLGIVTVASSDDSGASRRWRRRCDEIERLEPGLVTQQSGGVPSLTWLKDRVPIASARKSARSSAQLLAREVHDPGIGFVTLTRVKVSPDLQLARVYYTHLGDEKAQQETAQGARARHAVPAPPDRRRVRLRRVPELRFEFDESVEHQDRIEQILLDLAGRAAGARGRSRRGDRPRTPTDRRPADDDDRGRP